MAVDGVSGLLAGWIYDRFGPRTLIAVPIAAAVSAVAFASQPALIWIGVAVWGVVNGILDSTAKAVVAELVPSRARAVAFGWLALLRGAGMLLAGAVLGIAYDVSIAVVVVAVLVASAVSLIGLGALLRRLRA